MKHWWSKEVCEPTVIGISRKGVLVDHPQWLLRRRRHFRHWELVTLQPVSDEKRDRDGRKTGVVEHALEVRFLYGPSLWLLQGADMAEVRSASDPLREALGLDPRPAASSTSQT